MDVPEKIVDFGLTGVYDKEFSVNIRNDNLLWSPCFTGQEYSYDDKMQVQFQFQAYLTKEGYSSAFRDDYLIVSCARSVCHLPPF